MALFWKTETNVPQTLTSLVRGLQHAVNSAMDMLESRNVELLSRFFDEDGNPIIRQLKVDDKTVVDIPIISIINPQALCIKEVELDFAVQVLNSPVKKRQNIKGFQLDGKPEELETYLERSALEVTFSGSKDQSTMNVKVKFESAPIPEGMSRVVEEFDKKILPYEPQSAE